MDLKTWYNHYDSKLSFQPNIIGKITRSKWSAMKLALELASIVSSSSHQHFIGISIIIRKYYIFLEEGYNRLANKLIVHLLKLTLIFGWLIIESVRREKE